MTPDEEERDAEERLAWLSKHYSIAMHTDPDGTRHFGELSATTWREISEQVP